MPDHTMPDHTMTIHKDGRTVTIETDDDGDRTVTATGPDQTAGVAALTSAYVGQPTQATVHVHHGMPASGAFTLGLVVGAVMLRLVQRQISRRRHRPDPEIADISHTDVAALARRTANLERIITDPATRTANEIDALR